VREDEQKEEYMDNDTGTGTLYSPFRLFPSEEEALAECDKRNVELEKDE